MTDYKPGTVVVASVRGDSVRGIIDTDGRFYTTDQTCRGIPADEITDIRPLVVLDLEYPEGLIASLRDAVSHMLPSGANHGRLSALVAEIEQQTRQPKPPEPTGLGAVVVDDNDVTWVLAGRDLLPDNWRAFDGPIAGDWKPYARIDAVRVLSEGVQP